jgi:hypothetical protein
MDMEAIENSLEEEKHIIESGFLTRSSYSDFRENVIGGLGLYGNRFLVLLGQALKEADTRDSIKIMRYWNQACEQAAMMYRAWKAKESARISD